MQAYEALNERALDASEFARVVAELISTAPNRDALASLGVGIVEDAYLELGSTVARRLRKLMGPYPCQVLEILSDGPKDLREELEQFREHASSGD